MKQMFREDANAMAMGYASAVVNNRREVREWGVEHSLLTKAIERARDALLAQQHPDGHFCFELEADCTIPSEYILWTHFMDEVDQDLESKLAAYIRGKQAAHGGWPLYHGGNFDLSGSVKAYYALKLAGDSPDAPYMARARRAILAHGGAARVNVFTRITLALFGEIPWCGVPFMPVEIMLLPRWFPFHISKVSYWSRTVMVPMLILATLKPRARNPRAIHIRELFTTPPEKERDYFPVRSGLNRLFLALDRLGRMIDPLIPKGVRRRALKKAENWFVARLNGEHGLGGIFPAMVNAYEALSVLGYPPQHPYRVNTRKAIQGLLVIGETSAYCQPCVSPVWDTALAALCLQEVSGAQTPAPVLRALDWLKECQLVDAPGDWREYRPTLKGGGWPFQYGNDYYPDLDDTAVVAWALHQSKCPRRYQEALWRAADWLCGMQSENGGFAAFDADNTYYYLNEIPFADHGALLDPPTSDVSARCITFLAHMGEPRYQLALRRALDFLYKEQEANGAWYGRWGTNYIYGTWSVLAALEQAGEDPQTPRIRAAVEWLKGIQRPEGGWGEDCDTYFYPEGAGCGYQGTSFQTAWALLALMAAGEVHSPEVRAGIEYLLRHQRSEGLWNDVWFTAPGFPRVFYLRYHGYDKYFPLWALARYRNLTSQDTL
jgi:squalene-hopene cyclase